MMAVAIVPLKVAAFVNTPHSSQCLCTIRTRSPVSTSLFMGKKKKPSMAERRKRRSKRTPNLMVDRPKVLDELPPPDAWEKIAPTQAASSEVASPEDESSADKKASTVEKEVAAEATSLIESQRKSVNCLSFIRQRVEESFPMDEAAKALAEHGYFVYDGFLSSGSEEDVAFGDGLISEMMKDSSNMLANDKLERDITRLGDGEYVGRIVGGEKYADCPRLTEYVVSLTRHLPPLLNKEIDALAATDPSSSDEPLGHVEVPKKVGGLRMFATLSKLDATASMGTLRVYDRKTRLGAEALLAEPSSGDAQDRPFGVVCEDDDGTEGDARRITVMLYLSSKEWDASKLGGGISLENGERCDAIRDRMVLLRSDACSFRREPWKGSDESGLDQAGCVVVHFVKESTRAPSPLR